MTKRVRVFLFAPAFALFFRLYSSLWFCRRLRTPKPVLDRVPCVLAHWHGDELLLVGTHKDEGLAAMASRSKDGEWMGNILKWLGYRVVRGSSSRGGAGGLKGLIDCIAKEKRSAAIAVDGPRGPIYEVKPGAIKLAQQTGAFLVPGAGACRLRFVFSKAWNKCYLPLPFSRSVIIYGEARQIPRDLSDDAFENCRLALEAELRELKRQAEWFFERKDAQLLKLLPQQS